MSNPTEILPRTSIAAVTLRGTPEDIIRIYTQDVRGGIRESRYDGHSWTGGSDTDVITGEGSTPQPKLYSPITAVATNDRRSIRLYYLSTDNIIQELCQDNGGNWYSGRLKEKKFKTSPVSRLTSIGPTGTNYISVYYQRTDGAIGEIKEFIDWDEMPSFGDKPLLGTGLAAVNDRFYRPGNDSIISVFYQTADGTLNQAVRDHQSSNWVKGDLSKIDVAAAATSIAAVAYGDTGNRMYQLYFLDKMNGLSEVGYYSGNWKLGFNHPGHTISVPGSDIAVVITGITSENPSSADNLKYYIQDEENQITEYHWEKGWENWKKSIVPTGNLQ